MWAAAVACFRASATFSDCTHTATLECPAFTEAFVYEMHDVLTSFELECEDPCAADPCDNYGRCVVADDFEPGQTHIGFYCDCIPGFSGPFCQTGPTAATLSNIARLLYRLLHLLYTFSMLSCMFCQKV